MSRNIKDIKEHQGISRKMKGYQGMSRNVKQYQGTSLSLHNKPLSHIFAFQLIPIININVILEFEKLKISFIKTFVEKIS